MTDIKMSDTFELPAKNGDFQLVVMGKSTDVGMDRAAIIAINEYDANQDRIESLTNENALLENQLKNAIAGILELKKKVRGY